MSEVSVELRIKQLWASLPELIISYALGGFTLVERGSAPKGPCSHHFPHCLVLAQLPQSSNLITVLVISQHLLYARLWAEGLHILHLNYTKPLKAGLTCVINEVTKPQKIVWPFAKTIHGR